MVENVGRGVLKGLAVVLLLLLGLVAYTCTTDGARLRDQRVVEVRQVSNGFVVALRQPNNPYSILERVASSPAQAAADVEYFLSSAVPIR